MTPCTQPGCGGTIEADGYCGTCGMAPSSPSSPMAPSAPSAPSPPAFQRSQASAGSSSRSTRSPRRGSGRSAGYIVMEYAGGKSLKQILLDTRACGGSVSVAHALAYAIEVLPALGYLHDRGLVYCDFKPDNVIQTEEQLKLIDMGGVRGIDSDEPIYGTVGYQAPEIETDGPTPGSDLYTAGRALAVLTFEFKGFQGGFKSPRARRIRRGRGSCRIPRGRRVRRILGGGRGAGEAFGGGGGGGVAAAAGGQERPGGGYLATFAGLGSGQRAAALAVAGDPTIPREVTESAETQLALARARIDAGEYDAAAAVLADLANEIRPRTLT